MALTKVGLKGLDDGTDGQVITYDANGNPVAVGPGTDGQVLTSTGAGSPPAFENLPASGVSVSNNANNRVVTGDGSNLNAEANLTFDGSTLTASGDIHTSGHVDMADTKAVKLGDGDDFQIHHSSGVNYIDCWSDLLIRNENSETMIDCNRNGSVELFHDGTKKFETSAAGATVTGNLLPSGNDVHDLGSSGARWANIFTNDLNLSNEGSTNSVDGTWGSFTIQEGEDDLFLINRRNGKKYKFNLTEVIN